MCFYRDAWTGQCLCFYSCFVLLGRAELEMMFLKVDFKQRISFSFDIHNAKKKTFAMKEWQ